MFCIENYKNIIMRFLLHQSIVSKYSWSMLYYDWTLIRVVEIDIYYIHSFMKGNNCSPKLKYKV